MGLLLISVRQNRWIKDDAAPWLDQGDVPADPIGDLRTQGNRLSVWEILPDRSNVERVVCALAVGKDELASSGYVLFDSQVLLPLAIKAPEKCDGTTADKHANITWHCDLLELSGRKLVELTRSLLVHGETGQVLKKRLIALVEQGLAKQELSEKVRSKLPKKTES